MSVQDFADWYRSATLTPREDLIEKRWAAVQELAQNSDASLVLDLARLFTVPTSTIADAPKTFVDLLVKHDELFSTKDGLLELRVLAGSVLRMIMKESGSLGPLAALATICGSFGPRHATSPVLEHVECAELLLVESARHVHKTVSPEPIHVASITAQNVATEMSSLIKQAQSAIDTLTHTAEVREEEVSILWWLQSHFSKDLQKQFVDIGYVPGTLIFPMELADLTIFVPGSEGTVAVLVESLRLAGAPSSSDSVSVANATNATPREWREKICAKHKLGQSRLLTPILLALHKSLDTEGREEWLPVYRKACDIPADKPFALIQLSLQLFRERMLLTATAEAQQ